MTQKILGLFKYFKSSLIQQTKSKKSDGICFLLPTYLPFLFYEALNPGTSIPHLKVKFWVVYAIDFKQEQKSIVSFKKVRVLLPVCDQTIEKYFYLNATLLWRVLAFTSLFASFSTFFK